MPPDDPHDEAVANALIWGGVAGLSVKYPEATVAANVAGGFLSTYSAQVVEQLLAGLAFITGRRCERVAKVLVDAANRAGIPVDELLRRLAADEEREQLLLRTLEAASATAMERWLPVYAIALANGTVAKDLAVPSWETTFVRVVADLDGGHLQLLDVFTKSANELGSGGDHPDFDKPVESLSEPGLRRYAAHVPHHTAVLAVLERHGLVSRIVPSGGMTFSAGPSIASWQITDFGRQVHTRLFEVGVLLAP
ncbi:MAG TPA: hypothetical protein VFH30_19285 [Acidimicrobiales bacterium]|nr:hypothetical protein [Acidimicrobiales bacterium]